MKQVNMNIKYNFKIHVVCSILIIIVLLVSNVLYGMLSGLIFGFMVRGEIDSILNSANDKSSTSSIAIIGGADGPTGVFVTRDILPLIHIYGTYIMSLRFLFVFYLPLRMYLQRKG